MKPPTPAFEDELGDVLEKALRRASLSPETAAARAALAPGRVRDAIDYRSDLSCDELRRLADVLRLNEVGLCALGCGNYPTPKIGPLPFCVWPLRMPHGIGVTNAYLVACKNEKEAILFDTGAGFAALQEVWPDAIRRVAAVFLTHAEAEHVGGLCDVVAKFGVEAAYIPRGAVVPCGRAIGEGEAVQIGEIEVTTFSTPGHAAAHNCYLVRSTSTPTSASLLVAGDLVFAGSVGGAYFSHEQLHASLLRVLRALPATTVIAPGHGPLTTVENELRYNPFVL